MGAEAPAVRYVFAENFLLGSVEEGKFYSLSAEDGLASRTYTLGELTKEERYRLFEQGGEERDSTQLAVQTIDGPGGLSLERDYTEALAPYGEESSGWCMLQLPVELPEELSSLPLPVHGLRCLFDWEEVANLAVNGAGELFPGEANYQAERPEVFDAALKRELDAAGLTRMEPNFYQTVCTDFDGDGKDETLALAGNERSGEGYPLLKGYEGGEGYGVYSAALYQDDDGTVAVFAGDYRPCSISEGYEGEEVLDADATQALTFVEAADLNGDGRRELILNKAEWETGYYIVYALGEDGFVPVMRADYGL